MQSHREPRGPDDEGAPERDQGAEMLERHLRGEPRAFQELVEEYGPAVYGYLHRVGISPPSDDDLFQETFLRVHRSAERFDARHRFRTWLFTITTNLVRSHWRKKKVRSILTGWFQRDDRPIEPRDTRPGQERQVAARQQVRCVERALAELPPGPRQALLLTKVEGMKLQEAAKVLGVPLATVKTWVRRGRLALATALEAREQGGRAS